MENQNTDPLDVNVNDIDTSFPRLSAQVYDLRIVDAKKEKTKKGDGERLTIQFENVDAATSTTGTTLKPGEVKIFHYIGVTPKEAHTNDEGKEVQAYTPEKIGKAIAALGKAARVNATPRSIIDNPAMLNGATVRCKVAVEKETSQFPEANRIKDFIVVK